MAVLILQSGQIMERPLEKHLDNMCHVSSVAGALCADEHGLCLAVKGPITRECSGHVASIADCAARLHPGLPNPVICLESDSGTILIKKEENITLALYKLPN